MHARVTFCIFYEVSEIGAFMELFTVMIWLLGQVLLVAVYSKRETVHIYIIYMYMVRYLIRKP